MDVDVVVCRLPWGAPVASAFEPDASPRGAAVVPAFEPDASPDSSTLDEDDEVFPLGASAVSAFEPDASPDSATLWLASLDIITGIADKDSHHASSSS